mmetsp:Transcript_119151/g.273256  ORF Transcript_119151/g.273256 Transcript_119151/m.273256 type:complete len:252 (-) Transcript_119151:102-857(-)
MVSAAPEEWLKFVNDYRESKGVTPAFTWNLELAVIAQQHAMDMATGAAHFSHDGAERRFARCSFVCENCGENLGRIDGYPDDLIAGAVVQGWIDSPGHERNLRGPFTICGVGAACVNGVTFVSQLLAWAPEITEQAPASYEWRQALRRVAKDNPVAICAVGGLMVGGVGGLAVGAAGCVALEKGLGLRAHQVPSVAARQILLQMPPEWWRVPCSACKRRTESVLYEIEGGALVCPSCSTGSLADTWCFLNE